ncbi:GIY-YIG nuclease family protein [Klebsiella quasipneumoniae]|uniref:GIY-YIG nuclease family protein n=1 Tax=Klebsiella quasipneumoniae TaxID=1463165 RepID=UPI001622078F|nr:GIY-YIG nuclease family protein [Klebsiella quasipneumoniae]QNC78768.1 hypothetical protein F3137_09330 [Klebsiella quasipneumoniae]
MKGYVYAIQNGKIVKVGRSFRPEQRLKTIQTQGGFIAQNIFISRASSLYSRVEIACHEKLNRCRVFGEWFETSFDEAVFCINQTLEEIATTENEKKEESRLSNIPNIVSNFCESVYQTELIKFAMREAEWTDESIQFCLSLGIAKAKKIAEELLLSPALTLIGTEKIWICYPNGFQVHDKLAYITSYDKLAIANDIGCSIDDVHEWDDYSVNIEEEQHRLAA